MKKELAELLKHLKDISDEKHNQGIGLHGISDSLSEWNYGYSEGLEYVIEKIEALIN